jgi:hypothetical protein
MTLKLYGDGAIGPLSATEVGYLDGVTSGVQGQINSRAPISSPTLSGIPVISGSSGTAPAALWMKSVNDSTSFFYREVFKVSVTSAQEISRLSLTGSNGFQSYFKIIVTGHSAGVGNGTNVKEFIWTGGTSAPTQISTVTNGSIPVISFNNATNNVCIVNLASSNGSANFQGTMMIEWLHPPDFGGNTGAIS